MADLPQGRRPTRRPTRPLLLAGAGIAVVQMAAGCFVSGNLIAPPPCDGGTADDPYCLNDPPDAGDNGPLPIDGGTDDGGTSDGGEDAGT